MQPAVASGKNLEAVSALLQQRVDQDFPSWHRHFELVQGNGWLDKAPRLRICIGQQAKGWQQEQRERVAYLSQFGECRPYQQDRYSYVDVLSVKPDALKPALSHEEAAKAELVLDEILGAMAPAMEILGRDIPVTADSPLAAMITRYKAETAREGSPRIGALDSKISQCGSAITELDTCTAMTLQYWLASGSRDARVYSYMGMRMTNTYKEMLGALKDMAHHHAGNSEASFIPDLKMHSILDGFGNSCTGPAVMVSGYSLYPKEWLSDSERSAIGEGMLKAERLCQQESRLLGKVTAAYLYEQAKAELTGHLRPGK